MGLKYESNEEMGSYNSGYYGEWILKDEEYTRGNQQVGSCCQSKRV